MKIVDHVSNNRGENTEGENIECTYLALPLDQIFLSPFVVFNEFEYLILRLLSFPSFFGSRHLNWPDTWYWFDTSFRSCRHCPVTFQYDKKKKSVE
jgi:hypothetical protein